MTAYIDGSTQYGRPQRTDQGVGQAERPVQRAFWISYTSLILLAAALYLLWPESRSVPPPIPDASYPRQDLRPVMASAPAHYRQVDYRHAGGTQRLERSVWEPVPAQMPFDRPCELAADSLTMANRYTDASGPLPLRAHLANAGGVASKSRETKVRAQASDLQAPGHPRSSTLLTH